MRMQNADEEADINSVASHAIRKAQKAFEGVAEQLGFPDDEAENHREQLDRTTTSRLTLQTDSLFLLQSVSPAARFEV